jgi:hypothetical protein
MVKNFDEMGKIFEIEIINHGFFFLKISQRIRANKLVVIPCPSCIGLLNAKWKIK